MMLFHISEEYRYNR